MILKNVGVVPGIDGQKMSKSYKNTIPLFGNSDELQKAVMSIVTNSDGGRPQNVYAIHSLFRTTEELETLYTQNEGRFKDLKEALLADVETFVAPLREKRASITDDDVRNVLKEGKERALSLSTPVIERMRTAVGISL